MMSPRLHNPVKFGALLWRNALRAGISCVLAAVLSVQVWAAQFSDIVAFGDSLTDMGNRWVHSGKQNLKWRKTWVAQLAGPDMLAFADFKPSGTSSYYGGTNYAVGGAGTEYTAELTRARNKGEHLTAQISGRYLNPGFNTDGVKKDALHVIRIGTNDLIAAFAAPAQIASGWSGLDELAVAVARSTESQIQALAAAGVKHVLWGNLTDTAKIPSLVTRVSALGGERAGLILEALTRATFAHNREMDAAIDRLRAAYPHLLIIKLDLFQAFEEIARVPEKFGLTDVTTGANDSTHLFSADGLHPTFKGHRLLAEYAYAQLVGVQ